MPSKEKPEKKFTTEYWIAQCSEKDAEIAALKNQLGVSGKGSSSVKGEKKNKSFSTQSSLLEQIANEVEKLKREKEKFAKDVKSKNQKENPVGNSVYEIDCEMLEKLVNEIDQSKADKNKKIDQLTVELNEIKSLYKKQSVVHKSTKTMAFSSSKSKENTSTAEKNKSESISTASDINKKVTFTPSKTTTKDEKTAPKPNVFKKEDTSKLIRGKDLKNPDVLLETLVREIDSVKTKVGVIEKAVLVSDMPRMLPITSSNFYLNKYRYSSVDSLPQATTNMDLDFKSEQPTVDLYFVPTRRSPDYYRSIFNEKTLQLEKLQNQLKDLRNEQWKLRNSRMKLRRSDKSPSKVSYVSPLRKTRRSLSRSPSPWKYKSSNSNGRIQSPNKSYREESWNRGENSEDELKDIYEQYERIGTNLSNQDKEYEGRIRNSDTFDWTRGVTEPSMAFSDETLDKGYKYLRKASRTYDKEHRGDDGYIKIYYSRYGKDLDYDLELIERALKNSFRETENGGLEYKLPNYNYNY